MWDGTKTIFLFGFAAGISLASLLQLLYVPSTRKRREELAMHALEDDLTVSAEKLHRITKQMVNEMKKGLASDDQTLKMIPSFVTERPTGEECGTYLALDLGGSNFRVCEVQLFGGASKNTQASVRTRQKKYTVSDDLKTGSGQELFDFFCTCVEQFLLEIDVEDSRTSKSKNEGERPLGFTFSFPVKQVAIDKGSLMLWTKGFNAEGVEGKDVVNLLQDAFSRKKMSIKVVALVNDTVGTLVAHSYIDPQTRVGIILGTGTNAAYCEKLENIPKWKGGDVSSGEMIINTEWGAFDEENAVLQITSYDRKLDKESAHIGKQTYEKMISGMYLGEIVRLILVDLAFSGYLFSGRYPPSVELAKSYGFDTSYMSRIERDHSIELSDTKLVLEQIFKVHDTSLDDRRTVKRVCELVGTRAARLSAAGVAAIVTKMNRLNGCTVAIDGSLFEHYPHFGNRMRDALIEIIGVAAENIVLAQARDGSGQGAAIIAAIVSKK